MSDNKTGYVYILTNPSFREDWVKIGKSSRPVDVRSKELDNTAVPLPFEIYATLQTSKYEKIEKIIHKQIDRLTDLRIRQNREFFNVHPAQALDIFKDQADVLDDAIIMKYDNGKPIQIYPVTTQSQTQQQTSGHKVTRPPFEFSMVGLNVGDTVVFDALNLEVKVAGKNKIEYEGRLWSLSAFCGTFLPDNMQNNSGAYQGPKYFSYKGKNLWDLRLEMENN